MTPFLVVARLCCCIYFVAMKELEPDDDSDGSDSDDGIDELVGKALAKMEASKFPLKAFSKFNSRFLECGKVEPVNLSSSRGIVIQQSAPKG